MSYILLIPVEFQICMYDNKKQLQHYFPTFETYNCEFRETDRITTIFFKWKLKHNLNNIDFDILEVWYYGIDLITKKHTWKIILDYDDRVIGSFYNKKNSRYVLFRFIIRKNCEIIRCDVEWTGTGTGTGTGIGTEIGMRMEMGIGMGMGMGTGTETETGTVTEIEIETEAEMGMGKPRT